MEHLTVDKNIRLELVKLSMAPEIFKTIDRDRDYLKIWLPFIEFTKQVEDTENFLKSVIDQPSGKKDELLSIWYREEFAGLIGFKDTDWINRKTELGYWIAEKMQGKGIVTKCIEKLLNYSFMKLKLNRVQIKVAVGNTKSAAIPKRLNFKKEGIERAGELHQNRYLDIEIYSLLKHDWLSCK